MPHVEVVVVGYILPEGVDFVLIDDALAMNNEVANLPVFKEGSALDAGFLVASARSLVDIHFLILFEAFVVVSAVLDKFVEVR